MAKNIVVPTTVEECIALLQELLREARKQPGSPANDLRIQQINGLLDEAKETKKLKDLLGKLLALLS